MKRLIILALAAFLAAPYTLEAAKKRKNPKATWGTGKRSPAKKRPATRKHFTNLTSGGEAVKAVSTSVTD